MAPRRKRSPVATSHLTGAQHSRRLSAERERCSGMACRCAIDFVAGCVADGLPVRAQVAPRPIGVLQGLGSTLNPFVLTEGYREVANLPLDERVRQLRDPDRKARSYVRQLQALGFTVTLTPAA